MLRHSPPRGPRSRSRRDARSRWPGDMEPRLYRLASPRLAAPKVSHVDEGKLLRRTFNLARFLELLPRRLPWPNLIVSGASIWLR